MPFLPVFQPSSIQFLLVPRKFVEFLQLFIARDDDERIALSQLQVGGRVVFKPALPTSDSNRNQSRPIRNLRLAKR